MEIGILAIILFVGWFALSMIPDQFETHNNEKGDMWFGITVAFVLGMTLLILFIAGIFG